MIQVECDLLILDMPVEDKKLAVLKIDCESSITFVVYSALWQERDHC